MTDECDRLRAEVARLTNILDKLDGISVRRTCDICGGNNDLHFSGRTSGCEHVDHKNDEFMMRWVQNCKDRYNAATPEQKKEWDDAELNFAGHAGPANWQEEDSQ